MSNVHFKNLRNNLKRERLLSVSNIFVMTITFLILGIFITVIVISQTVLKNLEQQAQVSIFFKDDYTEESILSLEKNLNSDPRIYQVNYISKEDAFRIFTELNKDDPLLLESVNASILPASLEIRAKSIEDLPKLAEEFDALDGVEEVRFFEDVISNFRTFSSLTYTIGFALVFIFFTISYAVIISTLRMTIHSKGTELEIMKLVGATDSYVKVPLIYQGVFYGLVSSFLAGVILVISLVVMAQVNFIPSSLGLSFMQNLWLSPLLFSFILWFILILSGTFLGYIGSTFAVRKYLKY